MQDPSEITARRIQQALAAKALVLLAQEIYIYCPRPKSFDNFTKITITYRYEFRRTINANVNQCQSKFLMWLK
jgi:hypothetical protein